MVDQRLSCLEQQVEWMIKTMEEINTKLDGVLYEQPQSYPPPPQTSHDPLHPVIGPPIHKPTLPLNKITRRRHPRSNVPASPRSLPATTRKRRTQHPRQSHLCKSRQHRCIFASRLAPHDLVCDQERKNKIKVSSPQPSSRKYVVHNPVLWNLFCGSGKANKNWFVKKSSGQHKRRKRRFRFLWFKKKKRRSKY